VHIGHGTKLYGGALKIPSLSEREVFIIFTTPILPLKVSLVNQPPSKDPLLHLLSSQKRIFPVVANFGANNTKCFIPLIFCSHKINKQ